jgi:hypothetical protein
MSKGLVTSLPLRSSLTFPFRSVNNKVDLSINTIAQGTVRFLAIVSMIKLPASGGEFLSSRFMKLSKPVKPTIIKAMVKIHLSILLIYGAPLPAKHFLANITFLKNTGWRYGTLFKNL